MEPLFLEPTEYTPKVSFNPEENLFEISGFSRPENVMDFYKPLLKWLEDYKEQLNQRQNSQSNRLTLNLRMTYFNSASSKYIVDILLEFLKFMTLGNMLTVNWHYEDGDDEIFESGEEISEMVGYEFNFIPYSY